MRFAQPSYFVVIVFVVIVFVVIVFVVIVFVVVVLLVVVLLASGHKSHSSLFLSLPTKVTKMLGNGRLEAMCFDGVKRLCHIRGKLRKKVGFRNQIQCLLQLCGTIQQ